MTQTKDLPIRFQKGNKQGAGRPLGSKNKNKTIRAIIGDEDADRIIKDLAKDALNGDAAARRILVDKLVATPKYSTFINTDYIMNVKTQEQANDALTNIMNAVANTELSLEDAEHLMNLIQKKVEATQICIQDKLDELLEKVKD